VNEPLSIAMCAQAACIFDVISIKPGNVFLHLMFPEMTAADLLLSGAAIGPVLDRAPLRRVGETILECVRETRRVTNTNTNLGIILLLAPLASVQPQTDLRGGVIRALMRLDVADAQAAYEAIRLAEPGGLGTVGEQDVVREPTVSLREAMALAADRDMIARQYVNDFEQVFEGAEFLRTALPLTKGDVKEEVSRLFLRFLAKYPDSLIRRKHGGRAADDVSLRARELVESPHRFDLEAALEFDAFLRDHGYNPGTTADLVVASLFVALRQNIIQLPLPTIFPPG
jgi:triphosphoribosyl-dephospho-CoA synthase